MQAVDGNAIAGDLFDHFGAEMTTAAGSCAHCGTQARIAELSVYLCAPGAVVRCRACGNVVIVVVHAGEQPRLDLSGFALIET